MPIHPNEGETVTEGLEGSIERAEDRWKAGWETGPTRLRWTSLPPQIGDRAPDAVLPDHEGTARNLSASWANGPVLILFWRHFGCSCGMDRASRLRAELNEYR